jgi:predicted transcriptional regulator
MRAVWDAGPAPTRVRDVLERLNARRTRKLAYNTVQTMLTILKDKRVVQLAPGAGRAHYYRARVSRAEVSRDMVGDLAQRLFNGRVQPLLQQLIDDADLSPEALAALRDWVDEKLRDKDAEDGA